MAVLVRTNAQLPADRERARHGRDRRSTSAARGSSRARRCAGRSRSSGRSRARRRATARWSTGWRRRSSAALGVRRDATPDGEPASERQAALVTLLELAEDLVRERIRRPDAAAFLAELERRMAIEAGGVATGVELLTYHRAKGLEWDAVFLPALEEGTLPIRQATEPAELAEERRLLYVGITRARRHLWLSWATRRTGATGREGRRSRSRFLDGLVPAPARPARGVRGSPRPRPAPDRPAAIDPADRSPLSNALRAWRTARARADAVAPFIVFHDTTIEAIADTPPAIDRRAPARPGRSARSSSIATARRSSASSSARADSPTEARRRDLGADLLAHERDVGAPRSRPRSARPARRPAARPAAGSGRATGGVGICCWACCDLADRRRRATTWRRVGLSRTSEISS